MDWNHIPKAPPPKNLFIYYISFLAHYSFNRFRFCGTVTFVQIPNNHYIMCSQYIDLPDTLALSLSSSAGIMQHSKSEQEAGRRWRYKWCIHVHRTIHIHKLFIWVCIAKRWWGATQVQNETDYAISSGLE